MQIYGFNPHLQQMKRKKWRSATFSEDNKIIWGKIQNTWDAHCKQIAEHDIPSQGLFNQKEYR